MIFKTVATNDFGRYLSSPQEPIGDLNLFIAAGRITTTRELMSQILDCHLVLVRGALKLINIKISSIPMLLFNNTSID